MDWREALEIVVAKTKHEPWRALCDESHPEHEGARQHVMTLATGAFPVDQAGPTDPLSLPPLRARLADLAKTAIRSVANAVQGEPVRMTPEAAQARLAICYGDDVHPRCDRLRDDDRCAECGCYMPAAVHVAAKDCPLGKWPSLGG